MANAKTNRRKAVSVACRGLPKPVRKAAQQAAFRRTIAMGYDGMMVAADQMLLGRGFDVAQFTPANLIRDWQDQPD